MSKDKELDIKPLIDNFVQQGVLVPIHSPYNTPVNPVVKTDEKNMVLDPGLKGYKSVDNTVGTDRP